MAWTECETCWYYDYDEEYEEYAKQMMADYGYQTIEALEVDYPRKNLENSLLYERAMNLVMENAIRK